MKYIETFVALDESENEFFINVEQIKLPDLLIGLQESSYKKIFSLKSTGEIIKPDNEEKSFYIRSKNLHIVDPRKFT